MWACVPLNWAVLTSLTEYCAPLPLAKLSVPGAVALYPFIVVALPLPVPVTNTPWLLLPLRSVIWLPEFE